MRNGSREKLFPWRRLRSLGLPLLLLVSLGALVGTVALLLAGGWHHRRHHTAPQRRSLQGAGPRPPRGPALFKWSSNRDSEEDEYEAGPWAGSVVGEESAEWNLPPANCSINSSLLNTTWFDGLEDRFKDFVLYRHCRYFPLLHDSPGRCGRDARGSAPHLLFVIKSTCANHARRDAIRATWGQEAEYRLAAGAARRPLLVRTVFLVGRTPPGDDGAHVHLQKLVDLESRLHGDILQWDFYDTFYNLTLKEINFLRWFASRCGGVRYVFKGDDDVFVNARNVLEYLSSLRGAAARGLFAGDVIWSAAVIRRSGSKYAVPPELYAEARYPPYAGGGGFLMSGGVVRRLWAASRSVPNYPIDDVWLGMCLRRAGGFATQHSGFRTFGIVPRRSTWMNSHACFYRGLLLVHKLTPRELLAMWRDVNDPAVECVRRTRVVLQGGGGAGRNATGVAARDAGAAESPRPKP